MATQLDRCVVVALIAGATISTIVQLPKRTRVAGQAMQRVRHAGQAGVPAVLAHLQPRVEVPPHAHTQLGARLVLPTIDGLASLALSAVGAGLAGVVAGLAEGLALASVVVPADAGAHARRNGAVQTRIASQALGGICAAVALVVARLALFVDFVVVEAQGADAVDGQAVELAVQSGVAGGAGAASGAGGAMVEAGGAGRTLDVYHYGVVVVLVAGAGAGCQGPKRTGRAGSAVGGQLGTGLASVGAWLAQGHSTVVIAGIAGTTRPALGPFVLRLAGSALAGLVSEADLAAVEAHHAGVGGGVEDVAGHAVAS